MVMMVYVSLALSSKLESPTKMAQKVFGRSRRLHPDLQCQYETEPAKKLTREKKGQPPVWVKSVANLLPCF